MTHKKLERFFPPNNQTLAKTETYTKFNSQTLKFNHYSNFFKIFIQKQFKTADEAEAKGNINYIISSVFKQNDFLWEYF